MEWKFDKLAEDKVMYIVDHGGFNELEYNIIRNTGMTKLWRNALESTTITDEDEFNDSVQYSLEIIEDMYNRLQKEE